MKGFVKVNYSLPDALVTRIRKETEYRKKELGIHYGVQTGVVKQALEIGLAQMEKQRKPPKRKRPVVRAD